MAEIRAAALDPRHSIRAEPARQHSHTKSVHHRLSPSLALLPAVTTRCVWLCVYVRARVLLCVWHLCSNSRNGHMPAEVSEAAPQGRWLGDSQATQPDSTQLAAFNACGN